MLVSARFLSGGMKSGGSLSPSDPEAPHGCEPLGALKYPIGSIEWKGGSVKRRPISVQSSLLMWTEECYIADSTQGAASVLGGKRLKFNWDEQSRG